MKQKRKNKSSKKKTRPSDVSVSPQHDAHVFLNEVKDLDHHKEALASIEKALNLELDNRAATKAQEHLRGFLSEYQDPEHE